MSEIRKQLAAALFFKQVDSGILDYYINQRHWLSKRTDLYKVDEFFCVYKNASEEVIEKYNDRITFLHDDVLIDASLIQQRHTTRQSWYKQQFIKLAFAWNAQTRFIEVIIIDGDSLLYNVYSPHSVSLIKKPEPVTYLTATCRLLPTEAIKQACRLHKNKMSPIINFGVWTTDIVVTGIKSKNYVRLEDWINHAFNIISEESTLYNGPVFSEYLWYASLALLSNKISLSNTNPSVFRRGQAVPGLTVEKVASIPGFFSVIAFEKPGTHKDGILVSLMAKLLWTLRLEWR